MPKNEIFRAYDVRGVYGKDITEDTAKLIGKAFGTFIGEGKTIAIGRDTRNSGDVLKNSFISGLTSVGCDAVDIGTVTTPMMYFTVRKHNMDGGVSVTASHNPAEWNGFKMTVEGGILCSQGFGMEEIEEIFSNGSFNKTEHIGKVIKLDIRRDYRDYILSKISSPRKLRIVLDPGNGAACNVAEDIFRNEGHEVFVINGEPDGSFPNRPSDPLEKNVHGLKDAVLKHKADVGIAFDGDGDRVAFVDNLGRYVSSGNITIPIFSEHYLDKEEGGGIVYDICCSSYVEEFIKNKKGKPIASRVGHSFVMNKLIKEGAVFGGEYSNHLYFSEIFGFDDAIFAGLKMTEILGSRDDTLADIVDRIPVYPTSEIREFRCEDDEKFGVIKKVASSLKERGYETLEIDGVKAFDKDKNWILVRASNTAPLIKMNCEAKTQDGLEKLLADADTLIKSGMRQ